MYLLIDIGGTNTRVAVAKDSGSFGDAESFSTLQNFEDGIKAVTEVARSLLKEKKLEGVVVGAAGPLDSSRKKLLNAPNLPGWVNRPIVDEISSNLNAKTVLFNDTDLVALGEANFGAGRDHRIVAYLTFSTGVGGSRVVDGKLDEFTLGFEPGHQIIDMKNSLEDLAGGASLLRKHGINPEKIEDNKVWENEVKMVALGVHNTIVYWSPDVVVIGGSLMEKVSVEDVKGEVRRLLKIFPTLPEVKKGELGHSGGLWGALSIIESQFT